MSEIAVKPVALTRKNSLFSDSVDGAVAIAIVFSVINTATANNLEPYKYLEYIFSELPNLDFVKACSVLDKYLPSVPVVKAFYRPKNIFLCFLKNSCNSCDAVFLI